MAEVDGVSDIERSQPSKPHLDVGQAARLLREGVYLPDYPSELLAEAWRRNYMGAVDDVRDALRLGNIEGVEMTREEMARWSELMAKYADPSTAGGQ